MEKLEFNVVDNKILDVADFSWCINTIEALYVAHSRTNSALMPSYAIYIKSKFDLVELYYRTGDEILIVNSFKELCAAIKEANPNFEMCFPYCLNMEQVKDIDYSKGVLLGDFKIYFENDEIGFRTSKKYAKQFIERLEDKNININQ